MLPCPPRPTLFPYTTLFRSLLQKCVDLAAGVPGCSIRSLLARPDEVHLAPNGVHHLRPMGARWTSSGRSEEHTSELQSRLQLVCRLLLDKNKLTAGAYR